MNLYEKKLVQMISKNNDHQMKMVAAYFAANISRMQFRNPR